MFTGIVEELGEVVGIELSGDSAQLRVRGPLVTGDASRGDSIAINGVCLTVTRTQDGEFSADVMGETLSRSSLGVLTPGALVNLERPLRPDGPQLHRQCGRRGGSHVTAVRSAGPNGAGYCVRSAGLPYLGPPRQSAQRHQCGPRHALPHSVLPTRTEPESPFQGVPLITPEERSPR